MIAISGRWHLCETKDWMMMMIITPGCFIPISPASFKLLVCPKPSFLNASPAYCLSFSFAPCPRRRSCWRKFPSSATPSFQASRLIPPSFSWTTSSTWSPRLSTYFPGFPYTPRQTSRAGRTLVCHPPASRLYQAICLWIIFLSSHYLHLIFLPLSQADRE